MANCCAVFILVRGKTDEDTRKILARLSEEYHKANQEGQPVYIGCKRYVSAPDVSDYRTEDDKPTAKIIGGVRWGIFDEDMWAIVDWLESIAEVGYVECEQDEPGCMVHGTYRYRDGLLTWQYLPSEYYPDDSNDDCGESFNARLNKAFERHCVTVQVGRE